MENYYQKTIENAEQFFIETFSSTAKYLKPKGVLLFAKEKIELKNETSFINLEFSTNKKIHKVYLDLYLNIPTSILNRKLSKFVIDINNRNHQKMINGEHLNIREDERIYLRSEFSTRDCAVSINTFNEVFLEKLRFSLFLEKILKQQIIKELKKDLKRIDEQKNEFEDLMNDQEDE